MEAYASSCLFQTMLQGFGLGGCICQKRYVIGVVRVCNCLCGVPYVSFLSQLVTVMFHYIIRRCPEYLNDILLLIAIFRLKNQNAAQEPNFVLITISFWLCMWGCCIGISITNVIHMQTTQYTSDSVVQVRTFINFLTSEFGSSTRRERNTFLESLSYDTMLTKLKRSAHLVKF